MKEREKFVFMATLSLRLLSVILPSAQEQQDGAPLLPKLKVLGE